MATRVDPLWDSLGDDGLKDMDDETCDGRDCAGSAMASDCSDMGRRLGVLVVGWGWRAGDESVSTGYSGTQRLFVDLGAAGQRV